MVQLEKEQLEILRPMFRQIRFYMGRSVLDGMMGQAYADDENHPEFAMLLVRHYCYLSGTISGCQLRQLVEQYGLQNRCIVPSDAIAPVLKEEFPELNVSQRYSMRKDTVFDRAKLAAMTKALSSCLSTVLWPGGFGMSGFSPSLTIMKIWVLAFAAW